MTDAFRLDSAAWAQLRTLLDEALALPAADRAAWLARLDPAELLHDGNWAAADLPPALRDARAARTPRPAWQFDAALGERKLREQLQVATLAGFNAQGLGAAHAAAAALLSYAEHTQGRALAHVRSLQVERASDLLGLPPATHRNLELVQTLRGEDSPTLLMTMWPVLPRPPPCACSTRCRSWAPRKAARRPTVPGCPASAPAMQSALTA